MTAQLLTSIFCFLTSFLHAMENANIAVKCNNKDIIHISLNTLLASNALHEKYLLKNKLALPSETPTPTIVSSQEMCLFSRGAACTSQQAFHDFFWSLSHQEQKCLMSISGKDKLNSPLVTTLIATAYLPSDIIAKHINSHVEKKDCTAYLRCNFIQKNIQQKDKNEYVTPWFSYNQPSEVFNNSYNIISHPQGRSFLLPLSFISHQYTAKNYFYNIDQDYTCPCAMFLFKKLSETLMYAVYSQWIGEYSGLFFCLYKNGSTRTTKLPCNNIKEAFCSPNGNSLVIVTEEPEEKLHLYFLDFSEESMDIIKKPSILDVGLVATQCSFSHDSTTLFCISLKNSNANTSQLTVYDLLTQKLQTFLYPGICTQYALNHDTTRMILHYKTNNATSELHILNIQDAFNPILLKQFCRNLPSTDITALQYNNHSNNAVVQFQSGECIFIQENDSSENMQHTISKNPLNTMSQTSLLFTHDDTLTIHYHVLSHPCNFFIKQIISIYDASLLTLITENTTFIPNNCDFVGDRIQPEIVMHYKNCSFLINSSQKKWTEYILYTALEKELLLWIEKNNSLFDLYLLRRLLISHKNKMPLVLSVKNDVMTAFLNSLPTHPHNLQESLKKYCFKSNH